MATLVLLLLVPAAAFAADSTDDIKSEASSDSSSSVDSDGSSSATTESNSDDSSTNVSSSGSTDGSDSGSADVTTSDSSAAEGVDSSGTAETDGGNTDDSESAIEAGETESSGSGNEEPDTGADEDAAGVSSDIEGDASGSSDGADKVVTSTGAGGNSYIATVTPEDGKKVEAGVATNFTVTFSEMGITDKLGSAQLFIPDSLEVDESAGVTVTEGWGFGWSEPDDKSTFGKVLSLWALLADDYLGQPEREIVEFHSVSATFSATAEKEQTHHFDTKAWTDASGADSQGNFTGVGIEEGGNNTWYKGSNDSYVYSQPKVNVWVDQADSGYAEGVSSSGDLTRGDDLGNVDDARNHDGDLFVGLDDVRDNLNWHYVQRDDIDLGGDEDWEPIGEIISGIDFLDVNFFTGSFDGDIYTINNLTINDADAERSGFGLFSFTAPSAVINNVKLENVSITVDRPVGALVGFNFGTIINSSAAGDVTGTFGVGGLVGLNAGTIIDSSVAGAVTGTDIAGGLVGFNQFGTIINSHAEGSVTGTFGVGGLVGLNEGIVENSSAASAVTGTIFAGGLVGGNQSGTITNSHAEGNVTYKPYEPDDTKIDFLPAGSYFGGLVGYNGGGIIEKSSAEGDITGVLYVGGLVGGNEGIVENSSAAGDVVGVGLVGGLVGLNEGIVENSSAAGDVVGVDVVGGLVGGNSGTIESSHAEGKVEGIDGIGGLVGDNSGTIKSSHAEGIVEGEDLVGGLVGINNDGTIEDSSATGDVFGVDVVGGLVGGNSGTIERSHARGKVVGRYGIGGLVGDNEDGTIKSSHAEGKVEGRDEVGGLVGFNFNGTIKKSYATGDVFGGSYVGGLVGKNRGTIKSSQATGNVTGDVDVGGLVGWNIYGTIENSYATGNVKGINIVGGLVGWNIYGTIENSYATGVVVGENDVGGLVGINDNGTIKKSYATGDVEGINNVGGLVGLNRKPIESGTISNCYATGNVTGTGNVGGLVGKNSNDTIENSYATGAVVGDNNVGGLVGVNMDGGTIVNCFFNTETSGQIIGVGSGDGSGVRGLTTAQMKRIASYAGWNIRTSYRYILRDGELYPFPFLSWELGSGSSPVWYIYATPKLNFRVPNDFFQLVPSAMLTNISRPGENVIISPAFVTDGSAADLGKASRAYSQAQQHYEANKNTMSPTEVAVAETELVIAYAAIMALELSLAAQGGQAIDLTALINAYSAARATLGANRGLLTADQIAETEALLEAIATIINRYSA